MDVSTSSSSDDMDDHEFILNHVLLPRYLPLEISPTEQFKLVELLIENVLDQNKISPKTVELFKQLKKIHIDTLDTNQTLKDEINLLVNTDDVTRTFAIFMHRQNCTLLIHKQEQILTAATFCSDIKPYNHPNQIDIEVKLIF